MGKLIYISHEYRENPEMADKAAEFLAHAQAHNRLHSFVAPWIHVTRSPIHEKFNRNTWLRIDCQLVQKCDEIWLCGTNVTNGMLEEAEYCSVQKRYRTLEELDNTKLNALETKVVTTIVKVMKLRKLPPNPEFLIEVTDRLLKGRLEYGPLTIDRIQSLNLDQELRNEELDMVIYQAMKCLV